MRKILAGIMCFMVWGGTVWADVTKADKAVEKTIAATILNDPLMRHSRNINIKASGGVVYLNGTVESLLDKMQAGLYAEQTEGVTEVHNCLRVKYNWPWQDKACKGCADVYSDQKWFW